MSLKTLNQRLAAKRRAGRAKTERVTRSFEFKSSGVDFANRIIKGYVATWDKDTCGDIIVPGAFAETIQERGPHDTPIGVRSLIKSALNHEAVIGLPILMREDEEGLYVEIKVDPTPDGDLVLARVQSGSLDRMSFMYDVLDYQQRSDGRTLKKLLVYEAGPVDYACNERTTVSMKAGRVLSATNLAALEQAMETLKSIRDSAVDDDELDDDDDVDDVDEEREEEMDEVSVKSLEGLLQECKSFNSALRGASGSEHKDASTRAESASRKTVPSVTAQVKSRHPRTADASARLQQAAWLLSGDYYSGDFNSTDPPDAATISGVIEILQEVVTSLQSLTPADN